MTENQQAESDATTEGMPESPEQDQQEQQEQKPERTFSQAEVDDIVKRRVGKSERRYGRQIAELNQRLDQLAQASTTSQPRAEEGVAPKRADYEHYEDYLEARATFRAQEVLNEKLDKLRTEQAEAVKARQQEDSQKELRSMAEQRVKDGRKEYADFDAVIQEAFDEGVIEMGSELYHGLIESEVGHKLAYYLAKPENHAEAERLNQLSPRALQRELGKLELKIADEKGSKKSGKPPAMETLEGRRHVNMSDPMRGNLSTEEYIRLRNKQEFGRSKG